MKFHSLDFAQAFCRGVLPAALASMLLAAGITLADDLGESSQELERSIKSLLARHCVDCHGPESQEAGFRIDTLNPNIVTGPDTAKWSAVLDAINLGQMPPEDELQPSEIQQRQVIQWLTSNLVLAAAKQREDLQSVIRRLNREQYSNTMQDLLGVELNFADDLPGDGISPEGFRNNGHALNMSSLRFESYMRIAREALGKAIVTEAKPLIHHFKIKLQRGINPEANPENEPVVLGAGSTLLDENDFLYSEPDQERSFDFELFRRRTNYIFDEGYVGNGTIKSAKEFDEIYHSVFVDLRGSRGKFRRIENGVQIEPVPQDGPGPNVKVVLREYPVEGSFAFRVTASKAPQEANHDHAERFRSRGEDDPWMVGFVGTRRDDGEAFTTLSKVHQVKSPDPMVYEFTGRFEEMTMPAYDPDNRNYLANLLQLGVYNDHRPHRNVMDLRIHGFEFESPVLTRWPPPSHRSIFFESENEDDEPAYAAEILRQFMTRAYRRPPTLEEVDLMFGFWKELRTENDFVTSVKETLVIVLSSPQFLYIHEPMPPRQSALDGQARSRPLDQFELASRLSYFLSNTMPDERLFDLANRGQLREKIVDESLRLIRSRESWRFVSEFVDQWLDVSRIDRVAVLGRAEYTPSLRHWMKEETLHFFNELLQNNGSPLHLIDSDYAMWNEPLARFYAVSDVRDDRWIGNDFRRVEFSRPNHRGGVLTHAGILTGHSSGLDSHPVRRGVWLTKRLLNDPPPNAPPNVPELDDLGPDFEKMSVVEQLRVHRDHAACKNCHQKIDPWGIAFEEYDAIGAFRDKNQRSATAELPDGTVVKNLDELKRYLLEHRSGDLYRSVTSNLMSYALGRSLSYADQPAIEEIASRAAEQEIGLRDLVIAIVQHDLFHHR